MEYRDARGVGERANSEKVEGFSYGAHSFSYGIYTSIIVLGRQGLRRGGEAAVVAKSVGGGNSATERGNRTRQHGNLRMPGTLEHLSTQPFGRPK
jgi:hypothetical protein